MFFSTSRQPQVHSHTYVLLKVNARRRHVRLKEEIGDPVSPSRSPDLVESVGHMSERGCGASPLAIAVWVAAGAVVG